MTLWWRGFFAALFLLLAPAASFAAQVASGGTLMLTTNQTQIVHLDRDAADVVVNNPLHASVQLENPRLLVVTPHEPGTTSMIVLDNTGKMIMQRDIIVSNVKAGFVRVRRGCSGADATCTSTSYTYCPDGCYEVTTVPLEAQGAAPAPVASGNAASGPPPTIQSGDAEGEPPESLIGPADSCPAGYNKVSVPESGGGYTCSKR